MPELPEVERFRQILLPLVTVQKKYPLSLEICGEKPPRKWVSTEEVDSNTGKWCCTDVLRKGKLLCMVLEITNKTAKKRRQNKRNSQDETFPKKYFYLHMGMTGRLASTNMSCTWGHKYIYADPEEEWPPKYTYLILTSGQKKVAFADPRKFGSCKFSDSLEESFGELAPDGLTETITPLQCETMAATIANQRLGIKALILDQKRVVSGVGNWVADEVLYQCELHPDQSYLTDDQAFDVVKKLSSILSTAVDCLDQGIPYPEKWLFGFRWTKKKAGKDYEGRNLSFLASGGRTSAIVASIQKLQKSQGKKAKLSANTKDKKKKTNRKDTKRKVERVEKNPSGKINSGAKEEEDSDEDQEPDVAIPKKRKVKNEVEQEASKRPKISNRSPSIGSASERHNPDEVFSGGVNDDVVIPKKRKVKNEVNQEASERPKIRNRSPSIGSASERHNPDEVSSGVLPPKKHRNKMRKRSKIKEPKAKQIDRLGKHKDVEREKDDTNSNSNNMISENLRTKAMSSFSSETNALLKLVDNSQFREVGFAKWQRNWLPIIQLGPYDISPGPVRNEWMKIFQKTNKAPRLVYWYGSTRDNLSSSFSFMNQKAIVSYNEGIKQSHDKLPSKIKKKITAGKKLTVTENILVKGLGELKDESELSKEDRLDWLKIEEN